VLLSIDHSSIGAPLLAARTATDAMVTKGSDCVVRQSLLMERPKLIQEMRLYWKIRGRCQCVEY
jgi:hypothetical protein